MYFEQTFLTIELCIICRAQDRFEMAIRRALINRAILIATFYSGCGTLKSQALLQKTAKFLSSGRLRYPKDTRLGLATSRKMLEVEQKFLLTDAINLESKLLDLGFVPTGKATIVDWYFDTPDICLTSQDCWFRFREKGSLGQWQLKRGRNQNSKSTVYEELEGDEALAATLSLLPDSTVLSTPTVQTMDGVTIPIVPGGQRKGLFPFCRLETTRSTWVSNEKDRNNPYEKFVIDLDVTNTGYTVGEVETVVEHDDELSLAKQQVESIINRIMEDSRRNSNDGPPLGKLEHFLLNNRQDHYNALVQRGVVKKKMQ